METTKPTDTQLEEIKAAAVAPVGGWHDERAVIELQASARVGEITLEDYHKQIANHLRESAKANKLESKLENLEAMTNGFTRPGNSAGNINNHDILTAALLLKGGNQKVAEDAYNERVLNAATPLSRQSLVELTATSMKMEGREAPTKKDELFASGMGSSSYSLPSALSNSINKTLLQLLGVQNNTWAAISSRRSVSNFHTASAIRPTFVGTLDEIGRSGEIKNATMTEDVFQWTAKTYAKMFTVTRQDWHDDNIDFFSSVPTALARGFSQTTSKLFWTMVMGNAGNHFSVGNNNLLTANALDAAGLDAAWTAMANMVDASGDPVDIQPRVLVVGPSLAVDARQLLRSIEVSRVSTGDQLPTGNPWQNTLDLQVEARLENASYGANAVEGQWYLSAGPSDVPFIVGDGVSMGTIDFLDLMTDPNKLCVGWRAYFDRGVAFGEPMACIKSLPT